MLDDVLGILTRIGGDDIVEARHLMNHMCVSRIFGRVSLFKSRIPESDKEAKANPYCQTDQRADAADVDVIDVEIVVVPNFALGVEGGGDGAEVETAGRKDREGQIPNHDVAENAVFILQDALQRGR